MPATRLDGFAAIAAGLRPEPIVALHAAPTPPDYNRRAVILTRISNEFSAPGSAFTPYDPRNASPPYATPRGVTPVDDVDPSSTGDGPSPSDDDRRAVYSNRLKKKIFED